MANVQFAQDMVYDYVRNIILSGELESEKIYRGAHIAQELGVSRTPVRDALNKLCQEGFVTIIPSKGFCICNVTEEEYRDMTQFRCAIEGYSATVLGYDYSTNSAKVVDTMKNMEQYMKNMEECQDIKEFVYFDNMFHMQLVKYVDNNIFNSYYDKNMFLMRRFLFKAMCQPDRMKNSVVEHKAIFEAIKAGKNDEMLKRVSQHINAGITQEKDGTKTKM